MSPVLRSNWILLLLAVAMSLAIYGRLQQQDDYRPITSIEGDSVQQLEIWQPPNPPVRLLRNNGGWVDALSGKPPKDPKLPGILLHFGRLPSLHHFSTSSRDLAHFGLQPPRYRLKLDDQTLLIGKLDPASGLRYVQVGDQIHLVSDSYTHFLNTPL